MQNPPTVIEEVESGVLSAIIAESQANSATIEAFLGTGTAELQAAFTNLLKNIPSVKGVASIVVGPIEAAVEAAIEKYVANVFATYTPQKLFALYIGLLEHLQTLV